MPSPCQTPVIVALDTASLAELERLVAELNPAQCRLKVGKELFTAYGMSVVEKLQQRDFEVFLDLKFHDIPNTVARAVEVAASAGLWMVNVHASGGEAMLNAAKEAIDQQSSATLLIAVTVLTSMQQADLTAIGVQRSIDEQVMALAKLASQSGLDGVVCSARETAMLKAQLADDFLLVTPGIRPANSNLDDQQRVCSPDEAMGNGSDYLVIGRPITRAANPARALEEICASLASTSQLG